jgi:hypothetical protein
MYFRRTAAGIPHGDLRSVHVRSFHRCSLIDVSSRKSDLPGVIGAKPDAFSESPGCSSRHLPAGRQPSPTARGYRWALSSQMLGGSGSGGSGVGFGPGLGGDGSGIGGCGPGPGLGRGGDARTNARAPRRARALPSDPCNLETHIGLMTLTSLYPACRRVTRRHRRFGALRSG